MSYLVEFVLVFILTSVAIGLVGIYSLAYSKSEDRNGCCPICKYPKVMRTASRKCHRCGTQHRQ